MKFQPGIATDSQSGTNSILAALARKQVRIAFLPIVTDEGNDVINFAAYVKKIPLSIFGVKTDGTIQQISSAPNFAINTASIFNYSLLYQPPYQVTVTNLRNLYGLEDVATTISYDTGTYTDVGMYYVDGENTETPERVKFTTKAATNAYKDTMLIAMDIALVFYGQTILNPDQYVLDGSLITLDNSIVVGADLPLIIIPRADVSAVFTTAAGKLIYSALTLTGVVAGYVVYGNTILAPTQYSISGQQIIINNSVAIEADKQLVIVGRNLLTAEFITGAAQNAYTDASLNGAFVDYVCYGQTILSPDEYSLVATTLTLNLGGDVEAGLKLIVKKIA